MMNDTFRNGALVTLLVLATACGQRALPIAPSSTAGSPSPPTPWGQAHVFPTVTRPSRIYVSDALGSRYVLYDDGTFALQYSTSSLEERGTYKEANAVITFEWGCCELAMATLSNDSLSVQYSDRMQHSDFLNGVYFRAR